MKTTLQSFLGGLAFASALIVTLQPSIALAQGTAFTYQGRLDASGAPYTGLAEMQCSLWNAASGGSQLGSTLTLTPVGVTNGLFTVTLDFGSQFPGASRWLEIAVRTNLLLGFTTLAPRQPITATPYAITAGNLSGPLPASQLSGTLPSANLGGTYSGALTLNNTANSFTGSGAGLTSLNASQLTSGTVPDARLAANVARTNQVWLLGGNAGTTPGTHFVGTTDNQPLELRVNGVRGLRLEPTANDADRSNIVNVVGGSPANRVAAGVVGATIAGGGAVNYFGVFATNEVAANFGTIGGGLGNLLQFNAFASTIGGGRLNTIQPNATYATISGGWGNSIETFADHATIGGGRDNTIQTNATYATIGGGEGNTIQPNATYATIGGGWGNSIETFARHATIGGGSLNTIQPSAWYATIGGGRLNTIQTNAIYATIPGGYLNSAASYAFAAGTRAKANHIGSFVWGDSTLADFASTAANQFLVRAGGGVGINTAQPVVPLTIAGSGVYNHVGAAAVALRNTVANKTWQWHVLDDGRMQLADFSLGATRLLIDTNGNVFAASFNPTSDRAAKENFKPVDTRVVLEKVLALPITRWNFKQDTASEHMGPMAQDFHAAFGLGSDDKHIATVDADGVALAAIQGLNAKVESGITELAELRAENAALKARLERLEQLLTQQLNSNGP